MAVILYALYWLDAIGAFIVLYLVASQVLRKPKIDKPLHLDKPPDLQTKINKDNSTS